MEKFQVTLIGSGNVATVLGHRIRKAGHRVVQVYSRQLPHAEELAGTLGADPVSALEAISPEVDLVLIAVADEAIEPVAQSLRLPGTLVAHTAGSVPADILQQITDRYGVLYPLQSLRKERPDPEAVPLLVDTARPGDLEWLLAFAETLDPRVGKAGDQARCRLHVAAVFASNFTNHLFGIAESLCRREGLSFDLLLPLMQETVNRLQIHSPLAVQTGPAARGDARTIAQHRELLRDDGEWLRLYNILTESIRRRIGR